ncbi:hypothetical protein D3C76_1699340 [compost metagenome]
MELGQLRQAEIQSLSIGFLLAPGLREVVVFKWVCGTLEVLSPLHIVLHRPLPEGGTSVDVLSLCLGG